MPGPGGHHHGGPGGRGGMGGPGPRGGMHGGPGHHGGPRPGMGPRHGGFGGMPHGHRPPPPPPMHHGGYHHHPRPYRGGCCGCAIPALTLAFVAIACLIAILL